MRRAIGERVEHILHADSHSANARAATATEELTGEHESASSLLTLRKRHALFSCVRNAKSANRCGNLVRDHNYWGVSHRFSHRTTAACIMTPTEKRRFIKDPVWGHVEFFPWERILLRHELVNRLHGVCQTSCTFKVYPALRYSRFSHSIGALHVVTQMFVNIARNLEINAKSGDDAEAKERGTKAQAQLQQEVALVDSQFADCNQAKLDEVREVLARSLAVRKSNALALAVVRLGALLHDMGHLPYSHLFEHTLGAFIAIRPGNGKVDPERGDEPPSDVQYDIPTGDPDVTHLRDELRKAHYKAGRKHPALPKFHELLGYQFATLIANSLDVAAENLMQTILRVAVLTARDVWARELRAKAAGDDGEAAKKKADGICETPILSSLLSGHIDADRIDFVHRDSYFSGLFTCSVDSRRLFDLYEAAFDYSVEPNQANQARRQSRQDPVSRGWCARPSCRSASDAGKLLIERYQLYKYVVAHHRVHHFDELLERCLMVLLIEGKFNKLLDALAKLLVTNFKDSGSGKGLMRALKLRRQLLYIDDSWVDVQIRDRYAQFDEPSNTSGASEDVEAQRKETLFEAFLESRSRLSSAFKWDMNFDHWWQTKVIPWFKRESAEHQPSLEAATVERLAVRFRLDLVGLLREHRHKLETFLPTAAGCQVVIVGVTGAKVKAHIGDADEAGFFGLKTVNKYLRDLTTETMVFNLWFALKDDEEDDTEDTARDRLLQKVLEWLGTNVLPDFLNAQLPAAREGVTI